MQVTYFAWVIIVKKRNEKIYCKSAIYQKNNDRLGEFSNQMIVQKIYKRLQMFTIFYAASITVSCLLLLILTLVKTPSGLSLFTEVLLEAIKFPSFWIFNLFPFLIYKLIASFIKDYKKYGLLKLLKNILLKIGLPIFLLIIVFHGLKKYRTTERFEPSLGYSKINTDLTSKDSSTTIKKQKGIHVFDIEDDIKDLQILSSKNFSWITLSPFIGQIKYNMPELNVFTAKDVENIKPKYASIKKEADKYGIKIMLKPHIWLLKSNDGKFRADIEMKNNEDWEEWFSSYKKTIKNYALLAETLKIDQFCIGTELEKTIQIRPDDWFILISEIKEIYSGQITYAANWNNEYEIVPFWKELDFIGIQAYFPLRSDKDDLDLKSLESKWKIYSNKLEQFSEKEGKPILFTELGYRSIKGSSIRPWRWNEFGDYFRKISKKEQYLAYQAFFNVIWDKEWFQGVHIWEWQANRNSSGNNTSFTIENKPVLDLVSQIFKQ